MDFLLGGMASVTAELVTFPADMAKTRLQLQGQVIDQALSQSRYRGMCHTIKSVCVEEGFFSMYNGMSAAILRQATYGTIKIGIYSNMKKLTSEKLGIKQNLVVNTFNGAFAGGLANFLCSPTDMLKVRFQAQQSSCGMTSKPNLFKAFSEVYKNEGFFGLYRGAIPNAQRAAVVTGVELAMYDSIKAQLLALKLVDDTPVCHLMSSAIAGLFGALFSNPFDVIKSRMMNQINAKASPTNNTSTIYKNSFDCFRTLVKTEGAMALYRGFIPAVWRLVPWNIVFFMSLEQYRSMAKELDLYQY